jgi:hypothetical protein
MIATAFDEDNCVLGPPPGMTEDQVYSLSVHRGATPDGLPVVVSCWKPTAEELAEIQRTGRVWLVIYGQTMPPVSVEGISPFGRVGDERRG